MNKNFVGASSARPPFEENAIEKCRGRPLCPPVFQLNFFLIQKGIKINFSKV